MRNNASGKPHWPVTRRIKRALNRMLAGGADWQTEPPGARKERDRLARHNFASERSETYSCEQSVRPWRSRGGQARASAVSELGGGGVLQRLLAIDLGSCTTLRSGLKNYVFVMWSRFSLSALTPSQARS